MQNYILNRDYFKSLLEKSDKEGNKETSLLLGEIIKNIDLAIECSKKYSHTLSLKDKGFNSQSTLDKIDSDFCNHYLKLDDLNNQLKLLNIKE